MYKTVKKNYYPELDIIKGITILLVILGHSFCVYPFNINESLSPVIGEVVRSFQMPLFFLASGFLFSHKYNFKTFLHKKSTRIILPWFIFSVITVLLRVIFSSFTHSGEIHLLNSLYAIVQGHYYWFLYVLMIFMFICHIVKNKYILVSISLISILGCLMTDIKNEKAFEIGRIIYYFPFFVLGMNFRVHYNWFKEKKSKGVLFLIVLSAFLYVTSLALSKIHQLLPLYIVTLSGCFLTWGISLILTRWKMDILRHFGHYSLQYYLNHLLIMLPIYYTAMHIQISPYIQLIFIWLTAIFISFLMLQIQKQFKVTRLLCGFN